MKGFRQRGGSRKIQKLYRRAGVYDDPGAEALRSVLKMNEEDAYVGHLCDMRADDSIHSSFKRVNNSRLNCTTATNGKSNQ